MNIFESMQFLPTRKKAVEYRYVQDGHPGEMPAMSYTVASSQTEVVTYTADGYETRSTSEAGDIIMSGPGRENYVIKSAKFPKLYQGKIGETIVPDQTPRLVARYQGDDIEFVAPWGENMVAKPGDYIVKQSDDQYYRIARKEYEATYNQPGV